MPYIGAKPDKGNFADLNGGKLIIDADNDTSITADTDDQIDIEISGADDFRFTANTFTILSGSTLAIASGATIANSGTATGFSSADPASADGDSLGTASLEWSDLYLADGGVVYFGNDQDVTVTHDPDDGLFLKSTATADNNPFVLTLQTGETDIAQDDIIGQIDFQAPDEGTGTDAILVAGSIRAVSEGDFSSSNNATSLKLFTGNSAAAGSDGGSLILGSTGNLTLKDLRTADGSSPTLTLQSGDTDIAADDVLGKIAFQAPDEGTGTDAILVSAAIQAVAEGDHSSSSNATKLSFMTGASEAATEKMTISSTGDVVIKGTTPTLTIGDADAEDTAIIFDGNAQDFHIGLDDTADSLAIGLGSALGTTDHMVFDATGAVTMPLQPAVLAYSETVANVSGDGTAYSNANFANEVFDRNADFNNTTFTFTAPVTGVYWCSLKANIGGSASDNTRATARIVASNRDIILFDLHGYNVSQPDPAFRTAGGSLIDMDASDTLMIRFYSYNGSKVVDWMSNSFLSVYLVA